MAFVVFEGIDGTGKTTLIEFLSKELRKTGIFPLLTQEPGGTNTGQKIRNILLEKTSTPPSPLTEILLYYADRNQNIKENIKPALKKGRWVISDRYWASTVAYQYGGRGVGKELIDDLQEGICGSCQPDLWVLLDVSLEECLNRLNRFQQKDRFEEEKLSFHRKVKDYYLKLAKDQPERWLVLSGTKTPKELVDKIMERLAEKNLF